MIPWGNIGLAGAYVERWFLFLFISRMALQVALSISFGKQASILIELDMFNSQCKLCFHIDYMHFGQFSFSKDFMGGITCFSFFSLRCSYILQGFVLHVHITTHLASLTIIYLGLEEK